MQLIKSLDWIDPLVVARNLIPDNDYCAFLYSGQDVGYSGSTSILAINPKKHIKDDNFDRFAQALSSSKSNFENAWFGYLAYGLKNCLESLPEDIDGIFKLPNLWMVNYGTIVIFNHQDRSIDIWSEDEDFDIDIQESNSQIADVIELSSNMSKSQYLCKVEEIKEAILRGDLYEANLTRKFYGEFSKYTDGFAVFEKLCKVSPASYSSFIKLDKYSIISSSPEQFLDINADGIVITRPIKGSARRYDDKIEDDASRKALENSQKDKAENLMIVDLMRNDLSRSCEIGSINVNQLFEVTSYPTVHHMYSTVEGKKTPDIPTIELVKSSFPPGSMTGAPKIKAMKLCSQLEKHKRGVYSGAIGWFGGDGSADLSVVIRTIISDGKKIEFQVGGAITADSDPTDEWQETITKAHAIMNALNIEHTLIESI